MPSRKPQGTGDKPKGSIASWQSAGTACRLAPGAQQRHGPAVLAQPTVLVVQDTTSLNLTGCHALPELGPIGSGTLAHGILLHSTLALTEQGGVLGVLGLQTWARPEVMPRARRPKKVANGSTASTRPVRSCGKRLGPPGVLRHRAYCISWTEKVTSMKSCNGWRRWG